MKLTWALIITCLLLIGCSSQAPSCDDTDVTDLVEQIAIDTLIKLGTSFSVSQLQMYELMCGHSDDSPGCQAKDKEANQLRKDIDDTTKEIKSSATISVTNIRDIKKDDAIKKSECAASIQLNDSNGDITYTAQFNKDGELYVLVFGL